MTVFHGLTDDSLRYIRPHHSGDVNKSVNVIQTIPVCMIDCLFKDNKQPCIYFKHCNQHMFSTIPTIQNEDIFEALP